MGNKGSRPGSPTGSDNDSDTEQGGGGTSESLHSSSAHSSSMHSNMLRHRENKDVFKKYKTKKRY